MKIEHCMTLIILGLLFVTAFMRQYGLALIACVLVLGLDEIATAIKRNGK